jgi:hypothetical protein
MTYPLAIVLSVIVSVYAFASEITAGNIGHLQNGRQPNAGAALFPTIPVFQMVAVGVSWIVELAIPEYTAWVLVVGFLILTAIWAVSFVKLRGELARATENARRK